MGEASNDLRYRVLENWCLSHTGEKNSLEQAAENLSQILNDHVNKSTYPDKEKIETFSTPQKTFRIQSDCQKSDIEYG